MQYKTTLLDQSVKDRPLNHEEKPRRMGVEVEFAGLEPDVIINAITHHFGGEVDWISPFEITISESTLGTFKIELDSKDIKQIGERSTIQGDPNEAGPGMEKTYIETITEIAKHLVPWEIVTAPIKFSELSTLFPMIETLHNNGAKGTKAALHYAFGVHLNPDLPNLEASTIVNYLKSFFCLYEWIRSVERPDLARRITPYINHFKHDYVAKLLHGDYKPDTKQLIEDYLASNPTRNRSLDMLPLFSFLEPSIVEANVKDDRIKSRPTFHYRLPNCEITNEEWNLDRSIETWFAVEQLAHHSQLQHFCDELLSKLTGPLPFRGAKWGRHMARELSLFTPDQRT